MAAVVLTDAFIHVGGVDYTGQSNQVESRQTVNPVPVNVFGTSWETPIAGLRSATFNASGFWEAGTNSVDASNFTNLGAEQVVTFGPIATAASRCYLSQFRSFNIQHFGTHGQANPYNLSGASSNSHGVIQGQVAAAKANVSAAGAFGSGVQFTGAVSAIQYLYCSFHVFTAGTTVSLVVESDDNPGFTSATTRITMTGITAVGGTWGTRAAGAITDTYFRFRVTSITGTFNAAGAIGIG